MTAVLAAPSSAGEEVAPTAGPPRSAPSWLRRHRASVLLLTPLLVLTGVVRFVGLLTAPQRIDDEGTYVAQAWAVQDLGQLAHYTYWYDHPPLGWIQIAGWTWLTGAFDRAPNAVAAGREVALVAAVVTAGLLYVLARRLGVSRAGSAAAVLLLALSPLAVQFQRTVYLDNIAVPWVLLAFVLVLSPGRRLSAAAGAGVAFAVAVLSKETTLLLLPGLVLLAVQNSVASTRRYVLVVAGSLFVLVTGVYGLLALVKGELFPGADRVSLLGGLEFQLGGRASGGSVLDPSTLSRHYLDVWLQLDTALPVATLVAAVAGLAVRRLRALALTALFLVLFMLRPGYLPLPYVIALLPLGALLVAGVLDVAVRSVRADGRWRARRAPLAAVAVLAGAALVAVAVPAWGGQLRTLATVDLDAPVAAGQAWVEANAPLNDRMMVDDAVWVDLVRSGRPAEDVVWFYKVDTDPAVTALAPGGWQDYRWIFATQAVREDADQAPLVRQALDSSTVVATFGTGATRVDVHRVRPEGVAAVAAADQVDATARSSLGAALADQVGLTTTTDDRALLQRGGVDVRVLDTLSALARQVPVDVLDVPAVAGEEEAGTARHQVRLGGSPALVAALSGFGGAVPGTVAQQDGSLLLTWPVVDGS